MSRKNLILLVTTILGCLWASAGALAHEGVHLPGMAHPHLEPRHLMAAGALALAAVLALIRRGA